MALYKLEEFYPNYQEELFGGDDIKGLEVYARKTGEKIGNIESALVDQQGRCQYFIIDSGFWIFGKKFLLPVTHCQINEKAQRIYATGISNKKQVEKLPTYNNIRRISRNYEKQLRRAYHSSIAKSEQSRLSNTETLTPLEASASLESTYSASKFSNFGDDKSRRSSQLPSVTSGSQSQSQSLKLYEERLVPNKIRHRAGEVIVSKHIEKEKAKVSLPLKREKVVIERLSPTNNTTIMPLENENFGNQELTRIRIYEEIPDIQKQAFVREEVRIKKELEHNIVQAKATLRHEELDVNAQECNVIDRRRF